MTYITWFDEIGKDDIATAGGKGANLAELTRAGVPVPPGFVVTTDAYSTFVEANNLQARILELARTARAEDPTSIEGAARTIRHLFAQGEIPEPIANAICDAYHDLSHLNDHSQFTIDNSQFTISVAVRSSATAEDLPSASFAGQQETYLNVHGDEALLDAVKNCWASLWTARAIAYRARNNIPPENVALAVVVQQIVSADAAGILFTANPTTGARSEMVINAAWGLGEAIVSGKVTPDTIIADKHTGEVKHIEVAEKTVMTVPTAAGTTELPVIDALQRARVLSDAQVAELVRLGRDIEAHYGAPQDIEWCRAGPVEYPPGERDRHRVHQFHRAGDRFYIVQARPITALPAGRALDVPGDDDWPALEERPPHSFDLWTQTNVGEVWPHPVSPLLWSGVSFTLGQGVRFFLRDLRAPYLDDIQWARRFYGRVYYNEGAVAHILNQEFGVPDSFIDAALGSRRHADLRHRGGFHPLRFLHRLPAFLRLTFGRLGTDRELEAIFPEIDGWIAEFATRNLDEVSDPELWDELSTVWVPRSTRAINLHTAVSGSAFATFSLLEWLLDRWTGRPELAQDLVTGLSGVYTAEIGVALWEMACELRDVGLTDVILDNSPEAALAKLQTTPKAQPVMQKLDAFLQRHGHRCANEGEWLNPRWAEAPAQVIEIVAGYLAAGDQINPVETEKRQRQRREEAVAWVEGRLDPVRRALFRHLLARAQHLTRLRDNGKHYFMQTAFPFVRIYRLLGRRWTGRGWLSQPDDVFFLTVPDVERIMEAGDPATAGLDLRTLTAERRKAYAYWFDVEAPEVIGPDGQPLDGPEEQPMPAETARAVLQGIAASGGRACGVARIVRHPEEVYRLRRGDILVTRATDPGWTPVFPLVGGLVLEVGGQLSHGAIVAREYGVPAVVNVQHAMQRIADGDVITVDGTAGGVYLDARPGDTPRAGSAEAGEWEKSNRPNC